MIERRSLGLVGCARRAELCRGLPGAILLALGLAAPAMAATLPSDTLLTYEQHRQWSEEGESSEQTSRTRRVWLARDAIAVESGDGEGYLFHRGSDRLILLRHDDRTWESLPASATLFDLTPEALRPYVEQALSRSRVEVELEPTSETRNISSWPCRKTVLRVTTRSRRIEGEAWTTKLPGVDDSLYRQAASTWHGLDPSKAFSGAWIRLDGLLVSMAATYEGKMGGTVELRQELVQLEDVAHDPARYEIPEGYREVPLDTSRWFEIAGPGQAATPGRAAGRDAGER